MFEIQYLLRPVWKGSGTTKIAVVCNRDAHDGHATNCGHDCEYEAAVMVAQVQHTIKQRLHEIILQRLRVSSLTTGVRNDQTSDARFSDEALTELGAPQFRHSSTFESEFCSWMESPSVICSTETIVDFWKRHADSFPQLSLAARVVVAVPSSSAQIERNFGVSEMVVTADRGSLSDQNVDMICFVNRNDETFTDVTKCKELTSQELKASLSSHPEARIDSRGSRLEHGRSTQLSCYGRD